jgi:hypothetical protein
LLQPQLEPNLVDYDNAIDHEIEQYEATHLMLTAGLLTVQIFIENLKQHDMNGHQTPDMSYSQVGGVKFEAVTAASLLDEKANPVTPNPSFHYSFTHLILDQSSRC